MYRQSTHKLVALAMAIALLAMTLPLGFACDQEGEEAPKADFTAEPTSGTAPLEVQFTDRSEGEVTDWAWDFDNDGTMDSIEENPTHTYVTPGTYTVALTVTGPGGSHTATKQDYVEVVPVLAYFTASPLSGPAPLEVQFTDQSQGAITDWAWDFDDDGIVDSTEQNPSHTYDANGTYTVSLTVTGPGGSDTWTRDIYVGAIITIIIGYLTDWTGPASTGLVPAYYALEDLVTYINEEDPIPGATLQLLTYDTKSDLARFLPGYEWLKGQGARVIFTSLTDVGEMLRPFAEADKIPIVSAGATEPLIDPPGWVFWIDGPVSSKAKTLLKWISESHWDYAQGIPKIGCVGWSTSYDAEIQEGVGQYCQDNQDQFEYVGAFLASAGTLSWADEVEALKDSDFVCLTSTSGQAAASFISGFRAGGYTATFIGTDALAAYRGWYYVDGMLTAHSTLWWNEPIPIVELAEELLYRYRPGEAEEIIYSGLGYIGGFQQAYLFFDILAAAIEEVGAKNFDGQAFYDMAITFDTAWEGYPTWGFTQTKRYATDHVAIYEWSAEAEDLVRLTGWLTIVTD